MKNIQELLRQVERMNELAAELKELRTPVGIEKADGTVTVFFSLSEAKAGGLRRDLTLNDASYTIKKGGIEIAVFKDKALK